MALLTDVDYRRAMKSKRLIIEPFDPESLTPVGYDVRVGDWVASLTTGLLEPQTDIFNGKVVKVYEVAPHDRVLVLSKEYFQVPKSIGGDFHTKVRLVARGLSSISTTMDPGYRGKLFVTIMNLTDSPVHLVAGEGFTTLLLYTVETPTSLPDKTAGGTLRSIIARLSAEGAMPEQVKQALLNAPETAKEDEHTIDIKNQVAPVVKQAQIWRRVRVLVADVALTVVIVAMLGVLLVLAADDPANRTATLIAFATTFIGLCAGLFAIRRQRNNS